MILIKALPSLLLVAGILFIAWGVHDSNVWEGILGSGLVGLYSGITRPTK